MLRVFVCLLCCVVARPAEAATLSLAQFLEAVRAANPQVAAGQARAEAEQARVAAVGTWDDPFLAVGPDEVPFDGMGYVIRYQWSQPIPFPGKRSARADAQEERARGAVNDARALRRQLTLTAVQTYFQLLYTEKAIALNGENQTTLRGLVASTRSRYETGTGTHHEWLLASIEENAQKTEILRLERERADLVARLNELRNAPLEEPIEPAPLPDDVLPWDESVTDAVARQPEYKALEASLSAAGDELRAARLGYFPDFVVQGMIMQSGHEDEPSNYGLMLGATVPLFAWRRQGGALGAARNVERAVALNRQALALRLRTEWHEAERAYRSARDTVALYETSVLPTTKLALEAAQTAYAARTTALADYINVLRAWRAQQLEHLAARLDLHMAVWRKKELLAAPPVTRFAPLTPTLFGAGGMGGMPARGMPKDTGMGRAMPVPKGDGTMQAPAPSDGGMKGM